MDPHSIDQRETRKTVRVFSIASFLHDAGSDMIFSVWPLFLTSVLGANMQVVGLIDGLGDAIVSVSQAVSGYISDRIRKRKIFVWTGYLLGGIAHAGYAIALTWQWVIPFRLLDRSGKMRGSPRDAILSDISTRENRGRNFGILRMMDNAGAVVGIVLSILLVGHIGYRTLFLIAAIPSVLAVLLVLLFIRETATPGKIFKGIRLTDLTRNLKLYISLSAIFSLGNFSYSFLMLFAKQAGFSVGAIPVLYLLFSLTAALFSIFFGKLADRKSRKPVLLLSLTFWAATLALLAFANGMSAVVIAFVFYGLHKAALEPVQKAFAAELAPKDFVASALGGLQMVIGLCILPASLIAGILWDRVGIAAPFIFSLVLTVIAAGMLGFVHEERRA
ncbi:MAG: MFS transporter [Candidatus Peribacteraceae bacterium]|nr:MFS transporter [Candidatus Peribacteraceae bacterium]